MHGIGKHVLQRNEGKERKRGGGGKERKIKKEGLGWVREREACQRKKQSAFREDKKGGVAHGLDGRKVDLLRPGGISVSLFSGYSGYIYRSIFTRLLRSTLYG